MADRYWVGGSGNWSDDDNHWATSSGGAPADGNLPTASDNVFFDSASHTTNYTVTIDATTKLCNDLNFAAPAAGNVTLAGSVQITISGSMTLYSGLVRTYTGALLFNATSSGKTLTFAGTTMASAFTFNGTGGVWTIQDTWNNGSSNITLTAGTLDTNGVTVTCGQLSASGTTTRTLTLGASTLNVSGAWTFQNSTNLTFNANTSTINFTSSSNFFGGGKTFNTVNFTDTTTNGGPVIADSNTFATLTRTNTSGYTQLIISADQTVTGTLTITGNNANTQRMWVGNSDSNIGIVRTITVTGATVTFTNVDFADITVTGATPTSTSVGDCGGNTGIEATAAVTRYWVQGAFASLAWSATTGWSTSSGGAGGASVPLPQDTAVFDSNSFGTTGKTVTLGVQNFRIPTVDWTNVTNSPTMTFGGGTGTPHVFGSFILISGMTFSAANLVFKGRGNYLLTTATQTFSSSEMRAPAGKITLQDAYSATGTITVFSGEWDGNDMSVTTALMVISGSLARTVRMGNGTYTLTSTSNVWNAQTTTNLTFVPEGSTIKFTNSSISTKTFIGGGLTYNNFWNDTGSTGLVNFTGSNTFNDFKISATERTTQFTAGTTTTATTWTISGAATDLNTIKSITSATHTLAKAGGGTVCADYLDLAYSIGSPASTFYAGANSTDSGNNSGWTFTACPGSATSPVCTLPLMGVGT